jgi:tetratricopeptide (TPR) repeat protein
LEEVEKAYAINPSPAYQHQKAQITYTMGEYQKAYDIFMQLTQTDLRNGELYFEAAQCKSQLKAERNEILELLDSAISISNSTGRNNAAPYYLARGRQYDDMGEYKKAVMDYNQYDTLMYGRASHDFYYMKFKCESKIRQFQQALNDIAHAIILNRQEPVYYAEMASLQLRVNQLEEAITTCDMGIKIDPEYADPYIIKGIALAELNQKEKAKEALLKAKEIGDERADGLIEKYKL